MADKEHLAILTEGVHAWNAWRETNMWTLQPDLSAADLSRADLSHANLARANLSRANLFAASLFEVHLSRADLSEANLVQADLFRATLTDTNLSRADLSRANLSGARLAGTNLSGTNLNSASLVGAQLLGADLTEADVSGCSIFGVSAWQVRLDRAIQHNLIVTPDDEPTVTVDNLAIGQFVYLLLHNKEIRGVIDTLTSKVVLILGRFTEERKAVLDVIRDDLRNRDLLPVIFDFDKPTHRDLTETVSTLAHLARFIVADLTDPSSIPHELMRVIPGLPSVPVLPLLHASAEQPYGMFEHLQRYSWVVPIYRYQDERDAIAYVTGPGIASLPVAGSTAGPGAFPPVARPRATG